MDEVSASDGGLSKTALITRFWRERCAFIGFARRYVFDPGLAEDIFQEACLRFMRCGGRFRCYQAAASYVYRTIRTLIIDWSKQNRRLVFAGSLPEMVCEPEPEWNNRMLIEKLHEATRKLSPYDRRILSIEYFSDLPDLQTKSSCMELPISTFRYQSQRAVHRIRKLMNSKPHLAMKRQEDRKGEKSNAIAAS
jgi:RNA polymerase sigma factor (sigma-70 family)